jgi:AcrR family transcriptional regulator
VSRLIEERHLQTRARIAETAVGVFTRQGFEETTMEEVAEAAGVSRRTVYRHFPAKDDLVFEHPRRWLVHFEAVVATREPHESVHDLCRRALISVGQLIQDNAAAVLAAYAVYTATPSLRGRNGRVEDDWFERYVTLLTPPTPASPEMMLDIATIAGSLVGTTKALVALWSLTQPDADMVHLTTSALERLDAIWPEWLR